MNVIKISTFLQSWCAKTLGNSKVVCSDSQVDVCSLDSHLLLSTDAAPLPGRWEKSLWVLRQKKGPISWEKIQVSAVYLYKDADVRSCEAAHLVVWVTLPNILKGRITKRYFYWCNLLCTWWSQVRFYIQYIKAKEERRTHRDTQTWNSTQRRRDERRDQTSVSLSLLSTNHSKHLFMLDLYSTPPPPVSSIKHCFMSLHPFVQFGQIILCSGLSPMVIYELSERMHLIYWSTQIHGDLKKKKT